MLNGAQEQEVSEENVRALAEMGFGDRARVEEALRRSGNDLGAAANFLVNR